MILRPWSAARLAVLALACVLLPSSAQASLAGLGDVKDAIPELSTALPRELPGPCAGELCGELEAPQPKTRVRGFELDLYCRLGGERGLSCGPRRVWVEEYGERTSDQSLFTGHYFDTETNLYYAKARYFDPELGRFLSQDSYLGELTEPPSLHRYLYATDNPTRYIDPDGHASVFAGATDELARRDVGTILGYETPAPDQTALFKGPREIRGAAEREATAGARYQERSTAALKRLERLQALADGGYGHYATITIEESDFSNGKLDSAKVYAAVEAELGQFASMEKPGLRAELESRLLNAKPGSTVDISELYSVGYSASMRRTRAEVSRATGGLAEGSLPANSALTGLCGYAPRGACQEGTANAVLQSGEMYMALSGLVGAARSLFGAIGETLATKTLAPSTAPQVSWRNGWRTPDGKFAGPLGPGKSGASAEQSVWDAIKQKPGWKVIEGRVYVTDAAGNVRVYDGAAVSPRGRGIGLEVKSGTARRTAEQRAFDRWVNEKPENTAIGIGQNEGLEINRVLLIDKR